MRSGFFQTFPNLKTHCYSTGIHIKEKGKKRYLRMSRYKRNKINTGMRFPGQEKSLLDFRAPDTVTTVRPQIAAAVRVKTQVSTQAGLVLCIRVGEQLAAESTRERNQHINFLHLTVVLNRS